MAPPARVLFAYRDDVDVRGGAAAVMEHTAAALRAAGVQVDVSYDARPDPTGYALVHAWNLWSPDTALAQLEHLRAADAVVVWQPFHLGWSEYAWARAAIPAILDGDRDEVERAELLAALGRGEVTAGGLSQHAPNEAIPGLHGQIARMLALADHVCVCSLHEAQALARLTKAPAMPFTLVRHGVDASAVAGADPEPFRARFGVDELVLSLGAVDPRKNQLMLCEALRGTGLPLVLAGPALEPWYLDLCLRRGERVLHTGRIDRALVASALAAARVHALPSFAEGSALASLEAAAAGRPVVVSNRSSEFEYYGDGALFCDPADVESIRGAVLAAWEGGPDAPRRREVLRERMAELTWAGAGAATLTAYDRALSARAARDRAACGLADARARTVLAFAEEIVAEPALLSAYARGLARDATLVLHAPALTGELEARLRAAVANAGLDGDTGDLLALDGLGPEQDALLAAQLDGVLTLRSAAPAPFAGVPVLAA